MPRVLSEAEFNAIKQKVLASLPANLDEGSFTRLVGPAMEQAIGEAENSPPTPEGSAVGRFVSGAADVLNPLNVLSAVAHPIETAKNIVGQQVGQAKQAYQLAKEGRPLEATGHAVAAAIPLVGPAAAQAGEQIAQGDVAGGLGKAVGLEAPFALGAVARFKNLPNPRGADMLTREAEQQVAGKVLAPGNPAYRGRAAAIAPDVLARKMTGGRAELAQAAEEGMADAAERIDAGIQASGGVKAPVPVTSIIGRLEARIKDLQDSKGQPLSDQAMTRINLLHDKITQLQALGGRGKTAMYEDLRKIRDENYSIADQARAYERQGDMSLNHQGWVARETGGAIREAFAQRSPATAAANADYTFFKTLNDVLDPVLGRPKATGLPAGVTGGAKTVGAVTGMMLGSKAGAFILSEVVPRVREMMASPKWQLADAQRKLRLAEAMRRGDVGAMKAAMVRLEQTAAATSPTGSQSPTTESPLSAPQ